MSDVKSAYTQLNVLMYFVHVRLLLSMLFETGHPWVTFKDPCNIRYTNQHEGVVHSSNLCTEITLNTNEDEIAVCNLGSINLPQHIQDGKINVEQLKNSLLHYCPFY